MNTSEKTRKGPWIVRAAILLLVFATGVGVLFVSVVPEIPITNEYQAVFLDNGQVYFGKLEAQQGAFLTLTDVFYLQSGAVSLESEQTISLVKLGNEMHAPTDAMHILKEQVLYVENIKESGKVVQAIQDYQQQ